MSATRSATRASSSGQEFVNVGPGEWSSREWFVIRVTRDGWYSARPGYPWQAHRKFGSGTMHEASFRTLKEAMAWL